MGGVFAGEDQKTRLMRMAKVLQHRAEGESRLSQYGDEGPSKTNHLGTEHLGTEHLGTEHLGTCKSKSPSMSQPCS